MKKGVKKGVKKALAAMLAFSMCFGSINTKAFAKESQIGTHQKETSVAGNRPVSTKSHRWDGITTKSVYTGENFKVTFSLTGNWNGGYNANVRIENTGNTTIENWALGFDYSGAISNIWNAVITSQDGKNCSVKNAGWNQDITVGNSVEFGLSGQENFPGFPSKYELLGKLVDVKAEDYSADYAVSSDWGNGFSSTISMTNNTDIPLEDWILEFDFDREITAIWNGNITSHQGRHYVIKNAGYNSNIAPGVTISIGFNGTSGSIDDEPSGYKLYSYNANSKDSNTTVDKTIDTDHDGAPDYVEEYFGTDKSKTDTDGDGLSDYIELLSLVLDPTRGDTDANGRNDAKEDTDGDGVINIREFEIGTSISKKDTDNDGLNDNDEINVYKTDPLNYDTDGDGVSDAKEIELGTNPLVYEATFHVNAKADGTDTVKASVEAVLSGNQVESLSVKKYESDFLFPTNMPGYIGGAYEFLVDGKFDSATIKFEFDNALLQDVSFEPVIYYYNENTGLLEELPTSITGNIASAKVQHFSKYILLNRNVFQNAFEWQDVWSTTGYLGVEVILVIDDSGSMTSNDRTNQRLTVARNLVDKLPSNSKIGIIRFESSTSQLTATLVDDKETAKSYLTTSYFRSSGGTSMYHAINSAFSLFGVQDDTILRMMVVLSDGVTGDTSMHSSIVTSANNSKVKIYTVGLGSSSSTYFTNYLQPLANNTAGSFYLASNASQLEAIYDDINKKIDIETDSDRDGIADYYEENMVMFNGRTIRLDKNNPDSDGDGVLDGEEVAELNYQYNADRSKVIVTGKLLSNPLEQDTDGDGISDEEENLIGTDPRVADTDGDGLSDGIEMIYYFDPLDKDPDQDGRLDWQEYQEGTDPYVYNKDWYEYVWDFVCGFIAGDFIADTDSLPTILGQITSSFIPYVDIRDVVGNLVNGDYAFAGLSALGLIPVLGDGAKAAGKVGKCVIKNLDDIPKIAGILEYLGKNFPDVVKVLNKSDDFVDAAKQLSKVDNLKLTKKQIKAITEAFENAGLSHYLIKTSNSLDLKDAVNIGGDVWEQSAIKRGSIIDDFINKHTMGEGLGQNFPVADRLMKNEKILVSTKSLDIAAQGYQNPTRLRYTLEKYAESLKNIEKNYFDSSGVLEWGGTVLNKTDYNKKALEIVLPDVLITEDTLKVLNDFKATMESGGMEVWYRIAK